MILPVLKHDIGKYDGNILTTQAALLYARINLNDKS